MPNATPDRSLSAADAAFLYLERKEMPLAIACVMIFDGPIPFEEFVALIASKLYLVPRYQQVVAASSLNIESPRWVEDRHFNIRRHIFRETLDPPGGEAELETLVGSAFSKLLDRRKPLWEIHVVDGLKDGRGALIWRLHHALADGISGLRVVQLFLDPAPAGSAAPRVPPPAPRAAANSAPRTTSVLQNRVDGLIASERGLLALAQSFLSDAKHDGSQSLLRVLPEILMSVERLPFNKPCGESRKFCWAEFDLAEVQAIRESAGGRVNDVILTVLTRALARYVKLHGQSTINRFVRILCPVNLRKPGQEEALGNQISFIPVALPMDVRDPAKMLQAVAARTEVMKRSGAAALMGLAAACIAKAPPPLQALFWWWLPEFILPVPLFNMICTNVPGPPAPLYALGRRMIATYPQVPTGYDLGINCAVESYDGKLFFGLVADAHVAPDVNRLRDFLYIAFQELRRAARKKAFAAAKKSSQERENQTRRTRLPRREPVQPAEASSPGNPQRARKAPQAAIPATPPKATKSVA